MAGICALSILNPLTKFIHPIYENKPIIQIRDNHPGGVNGHHDDHQLQKKQERY